MDGRAKGMILDGQVHSIAKFRKLQQNNIPNWYQIILMQEGKHFANASICSILPFFDALRFP